MIVMTSSITRSFDSPVCHRIRPDIAGTKGLRGLVAKVWPPPGQDSQVLNRFLEDLVRSNWLIRVSIRTNMNLIRVVIILKTISQSKSNQKQNVK